jgi:hypothetical protein
MHGSAPASESLMNVFTHTLPWVHAINGGTGPAGKRRTPTLEIVARTPTASVVSMQCEKSTWGVWDEE